MVSRYHWIRQAIDTSPLANSSVITLFDKTFTIPVGGILKKFLLHNVQLAGMTHGIDHTYVPGWTVQEMVQITSGPNNGRIIYRSGRRIPFEVSFYAEGFINRYTTYLTAGDLELGFDQKCSYGLASDGVAWNVRMLIFMQELYQQQAVNWEPFGSHAIMEGAMLYYQ